LNSSGSVTAFNTFGPSGLLHRKAGTAQTFYTFDPFGNVCQRLDEAGTLLSSHVFDAYGSFASTVSTGNDPYSGYGGQWGYYTDWETGLQLCGHRYYDAAAGRWINRDPIGYGGGINLYGYVGNNPVNLADPTGFIFDNPNHVGGGGFDGEAGTNMILAEEALESDSLGVQIVAGLRNAAYDLADAILPDPPLPPNPTLPEGPVFSGHGYFNPGLNDPAGVQFTVPEGTSITFYTPHGFTLPNSIGNLVETGGLLPEGQFTETFGPGQTVNNYILREPSCFGADPFTPQGNPITVDEPTLLSDLLHPNMGRCHWAACRSEVRF
jgi:RHS repeat-associated protein